MERSGNQRLTPSEELDYLKEIYGTGQGDALFSSITDSFNVLQNRAQMLLSLITITLTITGFSGPSIARSSVVALVSIGCGLVFVLFSALILMAGPLRLTWGTRTRSDSMDQSLIRLIKQRNLRTRRYHFASAILVLGLIGYVTSVITYLVSGS